MGVSESVKMKPNCQLTKLRTPRSLIPPCLGAEPPAGGAAAAAAPMFIAASCWDGGASAAAGTPEIRTSVRKI